MPMIEPLPETLERALSRSLAPGERVFIKLPDGHE